MGDAALQTVPNKGLKPWKKKLIGFAVILLAMGGCYLAGRLQTAGKIDEANAETATADEKAAKHQGEAEQQAQRVKQLESRRQLHLMLLELDARNFGIAKQHQEQASRLLKASQPPADGDLSKLQADMAGFSLVATEDLAQQRNKVLAWVQRFDKIVPAPGAP